ncbi:Der GTPase-activating protein YihI [Lacimicrobium sp. SS2-24]|uniref:Der GTPase-activating protein YihI n=1 Tax=Lacimicrobium sp. SS2-24 TaxID=2005569 RepID=UPI000B4B0438|nr:Der GTPase-activating protein YihI [Lacimicrobium sp. SS2-24]
MAKAPRDKRIPDKKHQANIASKKSKKRKGHPAGSRHSEASQNGGQKAQGGSTDPRFGSKKPIPLKAPEAPKAEPQKYFSPAKELAAIEQDARLESLLDKVEQGLPLNQEEQAYVDEKLARHRQLCELLGIDSHSEEDESDPQTTKPRNDDEDALLDKFLNSDIKDLDK